MLVAADAGALFARREVDERPHPLHFHEVLVQRLKEQVPIGRHFEAGRAVLFDRHDAVQHGDPDVGVPADGQDARRTRPRCGPRREADRPRPTTAWESAPSRAGT